VEKDLTAMKAVAAVVLLAAGITAGQSPVELKSDSPRTANATNKMDEIYADQSHCLTLPEIRSDKDAPISCYCRDAIAEGRYVYFTYLLSGKDQNLNGPFLALQERAKQQCSRDYDAVYDATEKKDWKWNGPEVVRTYPADDVIERIDPVKSDGKPTGRWVPFTVQLVYRDAQGHVVKTENYSGREFVPILTK
jgi:hypothetical protein